MVDSPVWACYLDQTVEGHDTVRARLPAILGDDSVLVPSLVQMEVIHYILTRTRGHGRDALDAWLGQECEGRDLDVHTVRGAARFMAADGGTVLAARDAALLYTAAEEHAAIVTHDDELADAARRYGVKTYDPFLG